MAECAYCQATDEDGLKIVVCEKCGQEFCEKCGDIDKKICETCAASEDDVEIEEVDDIEDFGGDEGDY